ncbi:NnrU family protein [Exilibacterium tricleocarpae]|uniref:NnrU family protein n=1 Tax=Exilibacterium tricleocarpae TaxID=2591008 RepID=A0A545U5I5_9GAMM|nr:NnrU family protein [Exilibacterium tricleocarpae]TQV84735.1 NnrU family protein [Exilibacterium tricleocarpae]
MSLLIFGLLIFVAIHMIPSAPGLRSSLLAKLGPIAYKVLFSLLSLAGLVMIVNGLKVAPFEPLYQPPDWGRHLAMLLMLPAVYLFISNSALPVHSFAQTVTAHPVNWSVIIWSVGHLLANGDLAHVLLFTSLGLFAVASIITGNARGLKPRQERPSAVKEAVMIALTLVVYVGLFGGHRFFTGMPLVS